MTKVRFTVAAALVAAITLLAAGTASADENICVWSEEFQRWICVPPGD